MRRVIDRYARTAVAFERDALLREHGGLVHRTARRVAVKIGRDDLLDDLVSVGLVALYEAHQKFDPTQEIPFPSYAYRRIYGAMLDEARRQDVLPRRLRARSVLLEKKKQELIGRMGREPTRDELAAEMDWSAEVVDEIEMVGKDMLPIHDIEHTLPDEEVALEDIICSRQHAIYAALSHVPERLQIVLSLRFVEEFSVKEVGDLLGVSKTRAHGLIQEALLKVRAHLGVHADDRRSEHERDAEDAPGKAPAVDG